MADGGGARLPNLQDPQGAQTAEIKPDANACLKDPKANFGAAHGWEEWAVAFYSQSAKEANEDRVEEVFTALTEVEGYHIALSQARK